MSTNSSRISEVISLPKGGGAMHGIGEKFSPDLHTGTGNFTVPIALPPGRNRFQPQLNLVYSTGNGNGFFGLGWGLSIPGVSRKTSHLLPRYRDASPRAAERDVFILSGAEDLVPVEETEHLTRYQPRTEGLFARILHHHDPEQEQDYWEVRSKDGLASIYGTPGKLGNDDTAAIAKDRLRKFSWKLTLTEDPFNNRIEYMYDRDKRNAANTTTIHEWDQPLLKQIRYVDYTNGQGKLDYLVTVTFNYEDRLDPFSDYRGGFEIRTTQICRSILIETHPAYDLNKTHYHVRKYEFDYLNDSLNGVSMLSAVHVTGFDDSDLSQEELPPLTFGYTRFEPQGRKFSPVNGADLPAYSLANPDLELVDLTGDGLPDILQMNGVVRYWRNLGDGHFDLPRPMHDAPPYALSDPGVQMLDANGDGRMDLMVTGAPLAGYYPLTYNASWDKRSFQKYKRAPSFNLKDPELKLIDLDGDGVTDAIRSGTSLECVYNDPHEGWSKIVPVHRKSLDVFPNVNFSDSRVKWGDMTGDGLQDIALVYDGNVEYWPNLGYGNWGKRIHMQHSPSFRDYGYTFGYDPRRILLGDVDGDGLADIVYVGDCQVTLWINQSGNAWSDPIVIQGTPPVTDMDAVRLADLYGTGVSGILWSADTNGSGRPHMFFLDFTGGIKPNVMNEMDNHMGATTKVQYAPSTMFYLEDAKKPATRWKTPLPFPVQVVERVEVIDAISHGKLTTRYRYHHGYWDGAEREFRGFGVVEQIDTETFEEYRQPGLHGNISFTEVAARHFSPPTLTKTWFHQGPVGEEFGEWEELDRSPEYWQGDPGLLAHTTRVNAYVKSLRLGDKQFTRRMQRDALRALRGSILRSELYALDRLKNQDAVGSADRPYTVTEHAYGLREESPPGVGQEQRLRIFFPHVVAQRTTQWERGKDPMTQFALSGEYDAFGQPQRQTTIAMPRRSAKRHAVTGTVIGTVSPDETHVLATHSWTMYATPQAGVYIHDRVAQVRTYELIGPPQVAETKPSDVVAVLNDQWRMAQDMHSQFVQRSSVRLIGHVVNHYDGPAFDGRTVGEPGQYGALTRSEALVFTDQLLKDAYSGDPGKPSRQPDYLGGTLSVPSGAPVGFGASTGYHFKNADSTFEAGYYADTKRVKFDFQETSVSVKRGMAMAMQDALGHETQIAPDKYWLLPAYVKDAVGMEIKAQYNYRTLQPSVVTDPNGNKAHFRYSPIGLVRKMWLVSNDGQGGSETKPELEYAYDFLHFAHTRAVDPQPIYVHTTARVYHANVADPAIPHSDETIESREYSDGFGRLIQKRTQAEEMIFGKTGDDVGLLINGKPKPGRASADAKATAVNNSVVVSGWQTYDNKGRVVEKFEPFFDQDWDFQREADAKKGERATMFYDPRGQVIRTLNPDGSEQRVIFGVPGKIGAPDLKMVEDYEPTPWESYAYDTNDLARVTFHPTDGSPGNPPRPLTDVAYDATHYYTPTSTLLDGLGRRICQIERNGNDPTRDWFVSRSTYDVRGNLLEITDPMNRKAFKHAYDLLNRALRVDSIDAGLRTSVLDAQGNLIEYRDSKESIVLHQYDELNRPIRLWAINDSKATQQLTQRERIIYGDNPGVANAKALNLLGKPHIYYDEAGRLIFNRYDFKGNLVEKIRQTVSDSAIANGWIADWNGNVAKENDLDGQGYQTNTIFDALNRPIKIHYPAEANLRPGETVPHRAELIPTYNRAGALQTVKLDGATYVDYIAYNAKGRRVLIAYGNDVMTRYAYDQHTFRLVRLRTEKFSRPDTLTWKSAPASSPRDWLFQDFTYQYDLAGNITTIQDRAPACGIPNTPLGTEALNRAFNYDPIYRLLSATGREYASTPTHIWDDSFQNPSANHQDPTLTSFYTQNFKYDPVGNMQLWSHQSTNSASSFTRTFATAKNHSGMDSNRLDTVMVGRNTATRDIYNYSYDQNGNMIQETRSRLFTWDYADRMIAFREQAPTASTPSQEARYLYDASGMRVKKWVSNGGSTTYIDGIFEHQRWQKSGQRGETNHLHVMDNQSRVAIVREGPQHPDDRGERVQYHLGDHLGSSHLVVGGDDGTSRTFINREEFYPYGETSFGSFGRKRYRFTGKERDEESGLSYHGARYYAQWLARWTSCDPAGCRDHQNLFVYCSLNPTRHTDRTGRNEEDNISSQPKDNADIVKNATTSRRVLLKDSFINMIESNAELLKVMEDKYGPDWRDTLFERYRPEDHRMETIFREFLRDISAMDLGEIAIRDPRSYAQSEPGQEDTVKFIIAKAIERANEFSPDETRFTILKLALMFVTRARDQIHPSVSQSIPLRDADHYLAARVAEWRERFHGKDYELEPPSEQGSTLGLSVYMFYELEKEWKGTEIATSDMPPAPHGGAEWVESGVYDYLHYDLGQADQKGIPNGATKPSELEFLRYPLLVP